MGTVIDRPIFHITHIDNLARIAADGRLWCDAQRIHRGLVSTNVGYSHIKARRLRHPVTVAARGALGDYVPFNFCPRSVMLYVLSRGHVDYSGGQEPVVHLVSSVEAMIRTGRPWAFTDRHADLAYASQYERVEDLDQVDWNVMPLTYWNDPEKKEKRQAEFLIHDWCPWSAVQSIAVMNEARAAEAAGVLDQASHRPELTVQRGWYY